MSLYIKIYRRRRLVSYSLIGLLFFGAIVFFNQYSDTSIGSRKGQKVNKRSGGGININTYVQPAPCSGCPGENGAPVYLSVTRHTTFFFSEHSNKN
jgi:hypothetical protein